MASQYFSTLSVAVAGTGSSANLVASSAGQGIRIWQILVAGTSVLPMTGVPWAISDSGTAVTFTAATTTTVSA
jgi:hypothetical protein